MDFFKSLNEVRKNSKNFKNWEENQKDEEAKREELSKRRNYSDERKQSAKAYGEKIIDVVDIMDNHSENVAENVETALKPLNGLATIATFFGGNYLVGNKINKPLLDKIDGIEKKIWKDKDSTALAEKITQFNKDNSKNNGYTTFVSYELTSERQIRKIKSPELKKEAMKIYKQYKNQKKPLIRKIIGAHIGVGIATIGVFIAATLLQAKLQTDSSKIARFQARKELDDAKNFVMYTPEQIEAAKQELKAQPELKKKEKRKKSKLKSGMIKSIYNIIKDKRAYNKDKSARTDDSQKVTRQLTAEEIVNAEKDKEVIQRTVRIINNEAEKNSENMEVAANVIMGATPILGATIGKAIGWVMNKTGLIQKFVKSSVEKYGSQEAKDAYSEFSKVKDNKPGYNRKWKSFVDKFWDNNIKEFIDNKLDKPRHKTKLKSKTFGEYARKALATGFSHKWGRNWIIAGVGSVVTGFAGMMIALKLQKSAARAGRYTAKRDLEKNPENFIGYTQDDYNEVKDIKSTKKKPNKIKEYAMFIPTVMKQYWAYNKFRNGEYKERQALNELLEKQDLTDEQLKDAKNLQRKIFNTFEKVDDNSQVYSESMEAACEISQPFVWYGGMALGAAPIVYGAVQTYKHPGKWLNKITNKLATSTNIMQKKWFKNYLNNVSTNISNKVKNTQVSQRPLKTILNDVDLINDPVIDVIRKTLNNTKNGIGEFRKMTDDEQRQALYRLKFKNLDSKEGRIQVMSNKYYNTIDKVIETLINGCNYSTIMTPELRADMLEAIVNPKILENMSNENYNVTMKNLSHVFGEDNVRLIGLTHLIGEKLNTILKDMDWEKVDKDILDLLKSLDKGNNRIGEEQTSYIISGEIIEKIEKYTGKKIPKKAQTIDFSEEQIYEMTYEVKIEDAYQAIKDTVTRARNTTIKDVVSLAPEEFISPKVAIDRLKIEIEKMTDDEFAEFADKIHISTMDKKNMLEILPNLQKIFDNIPKEESQKIFETLVKEFHENPDEFIKFMQSGKAISIFLTPNLKKALITASVSWTAFTIAMTYAVEAWMADMQLKAGRLGVMKAMDSLQDPTYYANVEPTETTFTSSNKSDKQIMPSETIANNKNLLENFKH